MTAGARRALAFAVVGAVVLVGCGSDRSESSPSSKSTGVTGDITVSAASSLTEAFGRIGADFEAAHSDATVTFNFGSSGTLATQIEQGASADVFASADASNTATLEAAGLVAGEATVVATNRLAIVTKPGNPEHVETLADLATVGVVALCAETVPCGTYASGVLGSAEVTIPVDRITRGQDVKATLAAVTTGDADAAIVYVTDAQAAGDAVATVAIPEAQNSVAAYSIVVLAGSEHERTARAFLQYVASAGGQAALASYGFGAPS